MSDPSTPPPPPPPPLFARDYIRSAQIAALGYTAVAKEYSPGATGNQLRREILESLKASETDNPFSEIELDNFVATHRFVGSISPGKGELGADAVAFQNVVTGNISLGVAGVESLYPEGLATDLQTELTGANGHLSVVI